MRFRKHLYRLAAVLISALCLAAVVAAALFGLLQTSWARQSLTRWASARLSSPSGDVRVTVAPIEGLIPWEVRVPYVVVEDASGVCLRAEGLVIEWAPFEALRGRFHAYEMGAESVYAVRIPQQRAGEPAAGPAGGPSISDILRLVSRLRIDRAYASKVTVAHPQAPANTDFAVEGRLAHADDAGGIHSSLRVEPLGGPSTSASVEIVVKPDTSFLSVQGSYTEDAGGLMARAFDLQSDQPVNISLNGEGSLLDWRGTLEAHGGSDGSVGSVLRIRLGPELDFSSEGSFRIPQELIPAVARVWVDEENSFRLAAMAASVEKLTLSDLDITSAKVGMRIHGDLDLTAGSIDAGYAMELKDTALAEESTGFSSAAPLEATGILAGPLLQPHVTLDANVVSPACRGFRAAAAKGHFDADLTSPLSAAFTGIRVTGAGTFEKASCDRAPAWPASDYSGSVEAEIDSKGLVRIASAKIESGGQRVTAAGEIRVRERAGDLMFEFATSELGRYARLVYANVEGTIDGRGDVTFDIPSGSASANVQGEIENMKGLPRPLAEVTNGSVTFSGRLRLADDKRIRVENLQAKTPHATLEGKATYSVEKKQLEAAYAVSIPETGFFSSVAKRDVSGSLQCEGKAHGTWPALKMDIEAEGKDPAVGGLRADTVKLIAQARDVPKEPKGHLEASVHKGGQEGTVLSDFALRGKVIELNALRFDTPGGQVKGNLALDGGSGQCKGALRASMDDLSWLGQLAGQDLVGKAKADVKLEAEKGGQRVTAEIRIEDLESASFNVGNAEASIDLRNAIKAPYGSVRLDLTQGRAGRLVVRKATAELEGDPRQGFASVRVDGEYGRPIDLSLKGKITRSGKDATCQVTQFEGHGYGHSMTLGQSFAVTLDETGLSTGKAVLAVDPAGRIEAALRLNRDDMYAEFTLSGLGLDKIPQGDIPVISGTVSGSIKLDGAPSHPNGAAHVRFKDLRQSAVSPEHAAPSSLAVDAGLKEDALQVRLSEEGALLGKPIQGNLRIPLRLSVLPFAFRIPDDGAVKGNLTMQAELSRLGDLLLLDDQRLGGTLDLALDVSGTVAQPIVAGKGAVRNASYEHFVIGTVLKDVQATLTGDGSRLRIEEATASDGGNGRVDAKGSLEFSLAKGFPLDLDLKLKQSTLVRRDDVTATFDGDLKVLGTLASPKVKGEVRMEPAEINIPEHTPPPMVALEVVDKGAPAPTAASDAKIAPHSLSNHDKLLPGGLRARLGLDIDIETPGRTFVRGRGIDSEWKGSFHVTGSAIEPSIAGNASLVRGRLSLLGKRFALTKGVVQFGGGWPPAPALDVESETQLKDMTGFLKVSGTTAAPAVTIESDPPAARDEILARMLFNRDLAHVSPIEALQLAEAADVLAGRKGLFQFTERARKILRVDNIDVAQDNGDMKDSSVRVGKYLRDDVYVQVEQGLGAETGKVQTEVNITPNLSVESTVDRNAKTGIGLKWKKDY